MQLICRAVLGCALIVISLPSCEAWIHGSGTPPNVSIPVSSLSTGNYSANNWAGIASPATTVATSGGLKYIQSQTNVVGQMLATGTANWRDQEITSYVSRGEFLLRMSGGSGLFFSVGLACAGCVRIGIVTGFDPTNPEGGSARYNTYAQDTPTSCIASWPSDGSHTITFGARGFNVYLKIDGVQAIDTCQTRPINLTGAISYSEYRSQAMGAGQALIWAHGSSVGCRDILITYFTNAALYSNYVASIFDPRDFGWRPVPAVTGSMSASGSVLTLTAARDFRVGDHVIVEIGGESGAGARNTIGVGGVTPSLHYVDAATMNADHSKADGTLAYLDTTGVVYGYSTGTSTWTAYGLGGTYYAGIKNPLSLRATVTAVNGSPATQLTLSSTAAVATSSANVYLDFALSLYPLTTWPSKNFADRNDGLDAYSGITFSIPDGSFVTGGKSQILGGNNRDGFTLKGNGRTSTLIAAARGVDSSFVATEFNDNTTIRDLGWTGNLGANGYGFLLAASGQFVNYPIFANILGNNTVGLNLGITNQFGGGITLTGTNPTLDGIIGNFTLGQNAYLGWQVQLSNCMGGIIKNSTVTATFLVKSFEMFACNGAEIRDVTGTNALLSTNSSTNVAFTRPTITITSGSFYDISSGALDEPILSINNSAFGTGNTVAVTDPRIIQSGYVDGVQESLKAIQVIHANITDVTISGQFPGAGGCSTSLGGLFQAPNFVPGAVEYGSMAIYSDAARTIVNGIRVKGSAIGSPGHSLHFGNISLLGASSQANNNVADVIQSGPTLSGNQTNTAYGGC